MYKHIYFEPWIGRYYRKRPRPRILVLGESHYEASIQNRDFTRKLTEQFVRGDWAHRFWTNISQVISGRHHTEIDRAATWHGIAFYNYIQVIAANRPRKAPTPQMFSDAEPAFFELLAKLRPTHVIVCGFRLWCDLPPFGGRTGTFRQGRRVHPWGEYVVGGHVIRAMPICHPSTGFSAPHWNPAVRRFLSDDLPDRRRR